MFNTLFCSYSYCQYIAGIVHNAEVGVQHPVFYLWLTAAALRGVRKQLGMEKKQPELFLSEINNRETIAAIEANNDTYCFQKRIEKFPLKRVFYPVTLYSNERLERPI